MKQISIFFLVLYLTLESSARNSDNVKAGRRYMDDRTGWNVQSSTFITKPSKGGHGWVWTSKHKRPSFSEHTIIDGDGNLVSAGGTSWGGSMGGGMFGFGSPGGMFFSGPNSLLNEDEDIIDSNGNVIILDGPGMVGGGAIVDGKGKGGGISWGGSTGGGTFGFGSSGGMFFSGDNSPLNEEERIIDGNGNVIFMEGPGMVGGGAIVGGNGNGGGMAWGGGFGGNTVGSGQTSGGGQMGTGLMGGGTVEGDVSGGGMAWGGGFGGNTVGSGQTSGGGQMGSGQMGGGNMEGGTVEGNVSGGGMAAGAGTTTGREMAQNAWRPEMAWGGGGAEGTEGTTDYGGVADVGMEGGVFEGNYI